MISEKIIKKLVLSGIKTPDDLARLKRKLAKKYKIPLLSNLVLLKSYRNLIKKSKIKNKNGFEFLLRTRPIRSLSGIVNISVLTKPYPCPGKCLYCPAEKGIPKSYVSGEPAVERAKALKYDPYLQVKRRIEMLENEGHPTDKIELRIVGGTWSYYPKNYQDWFVKKCFEACNDRSPKSKIKSFKDDQRRNENAKHRIIGLSIETRPDFINEKEIKHLRELGATMIELGVQSIYDDVLKLNFRGHRTKETILATKLLKDAGFKVLYQIMPNLPGSNLKRDERMFKELFQNSAFRPDMLKIYPCALLKEAPLYKLYKSGKYKPYNQSELINLIKKIKMGIPSYVRIQRITRDIPSKSIVAGAASISNLRQILAEDMKNHDWKCNCIRCREVKRDYDPKEKIFLFRRDCQASGGKEIFLSWENKEKTKLYSLLRLRLVQIDSSPVAMIRELHTFGQLAALKYSSGQRTSPQHRGLGKKLVKKAEEISRKESAAKKIAVISGIGVRGYFRELGYKLEKTYMKKDLRG